MEDEPIQVIIDNQTKMTFFQKQSTGR
jgi:hypothetical protein